MRKQGTENVEDELRPEYDLSQLKGGIRGKYYQQAKEGTNLILIDPNLSQAFPDEASVNRALRLLLGTANAAIQKLHKRRTPPNQALNRTRKKQRAG
jgi:hypothetical protein